MTENTENLVLEILRRLQNEISGIHREMREDFREIKTRLTLLEQHFATHTAALANQSGRIDRLEQRLERVERRLELRDEA